MRYQYRRFKHFTRNKLSNVYLIIYSNSCTYFALLLQYHLTARMVNERDVYKPTHTHVQLVFKTLIFGNQTFLNSLYAIRSRSVILKNCSIYLNPAVVYTSKKTKFHFKLLSPPPFFSHDGEQKP